MATQIPNKFIQNNLSLKAFIEDRKAGATEGGACNGVSAGTWFQRNLNYISANGTGITLSSNQLSVPAGTWDIDVECPSFANANRFMCRLYNVSDSSLICQGRQGNTDVASSDYSRIICRFTLASTKTLEIDQIVQSAASNADCLGRAACHISTALNGKCDYERYTQGTITKVSP